MSGRLLGILVAALLVVGGAALWLHQKERAAQPPAVATLGEPLFKALQAADIASIRITEPGASVTVRRSGERWVVAERGDFPADFAKVRDFVLKALALKIGQSEPIGAPDRARLKLAEPPAPEGGGTLVEFLAADGKPLASMIVGGKYFKKPEQSERAPGDGRFVLRPDAPGTAVIVADPLEQAGAKTSLWIERRALAADEPVTIDVKRADGDRWRLERGPDASGAWKLAGAKPGEKLNETTILAVAAAAGGLDIADVVARDPQREAKVLAKPTIVTVTTRDGLTYTLTIGAAEDRNRYATATIEGKLPEARKPAGEEKPADAAARDKVFAERLGKVRARRPEADTLAKFAVLVPDTTLVDLTKPRAELLEKPPAKP